jgi:hypothetical protein
MPKLFQIDIANIKVHNGYHSNKFVNDIALIRLAQPAKLNPGAGVVCMPG